MTDNKMSSIVRFVLMMLLLSASCSEATRPDPDTAKPEWESYWISKLPDVRSPQSLAALSTSMTKEQTNDYLKIMNERAEMKAAGISDECQQGEDMCEDDDDACNEKLERCTKKASERGIVESNNACKEGDLCEEKIADIGGSAVCISPFIYNYATSCPNGSAMAMTTMKEVFFRPEDVQVGKTIMYPRLANDLDGRHFLPDELARSMPLTSDRLSSYMSLLGIPPKSQMAQDMETTTHLCQQSSSQIDRFDLTLAPSSSPHINSSDFACLSSIESMVDFASSHLPSISLALTPPFTPSSHLPLLIASSPSTLSLASVSCHPLSFPYLVYGCHYIDSTSVISVELQNTSSNARSQGLAVCHSNTSTWSPDHPVFTALDAHPGDGAICHWVPENNFVWF